MAVTRYPRELRIRVPQGLPDALALAADQHHTTPAEWARQALLRGLQAEGVSIRDGTAVHDQNGCSAPSLHAA